MAAKNGWPRYGDKDYVEYVLRYYHSGEGNVVVVGDGTQRFDVDKVHNFMKNFLGLLYVWGRGRQLLEVSIFQDYGKCFRQVRIDMTDTAQA